MEEFNSSRSNDQRQVSPFSLSTTMTVGTTIINRWPTERFCDMKSRVTCNVSKIVQGVRINHCAQWCSCLRQESTPTSSCDASSLGRPGRGTASGELFGGLKFQDVLEALHPWSGRGRCVLFLPVIVVAANVSGRSVYYLATYKLLGFCLRTCQDDQT